MYNKKTKTMKEKMSYVKPSVQKVEFDFKTRIAASGGIRYVPDDPSCTIDGD